MVDGMVHGSTFTQSLDPGQGFTRAPEAVVDRNTGDVQSPSWHEERLNQQWLKNHVADAESRALDHPQYWQE
jgi:hypothetical protein